MGKTFVGSHKANSLPRHFSKQANGGNFVHSRGTLLKSNSENGCNNLDSSASCDQNKHLGNGVPGNVSTLKNSNCVSVIDRDSCEVWCICRLLKPCQTCKDKNHPTTGDTRETTPTPDSKVKAVTSPGSSQGSSSSSGSSATPTSEGSGVPRVSYRSSGSSDSGSLVQIFVEDFDGEHTPRLNIRSDRHHSRNASGDELRHTNSRTFVNGSTTSDINGARECSGINLEELFRKLDELNAAHDALEGFPGPGRPKVADTPPGSPSGSMDSASVCSGFDHFDFDTSFCSLKSTGKNNGFLISAACNKTVVDLND